MKITHKVLDLFDMAEAYHLSHAILALDQCGILASMSKPITLSSLARLHAVHLPTLGAILHYLSDRTDLVSRKAGKFHLTRHYNLEAKFIIQQYFRAYGRNAMALDRILLDPSLAYSLIDREQHSVAYKDVATVSSGILTGLLSQLKVTQLLDIGCGGGQMLCALATSNPDFVGWGLDISAPMCKVARKNASAVSDRVKFFEGDCRNLRKAIPPSVLDRVCAISVASVANEFFADGSKGIVRWLSAIRSILPDRLMLISDYYGCLGTSRPRLRQVLLHDFVQVISGQGVPPSKLAEWRKVYRLAQCKLVHVIEDQNAGSFVHFVRT